MPEISAKFSDVFEFDPPPLNPMDPTKNSPSNNLEISRVSSASDKGRRPSSSGSSGRTGASGKDGKKSKSLPRSSKERLLTGVTKMASWLSTSEPSALALKQHKKDAFERAGIPLDNRDGQASARLHAPIGEVPPDAIRPAGGLTPEKIAKKKAAEQRQRQQDQSYTGERRGSGGVGRASSSGLSSASTADMSVRKGSVSCPWEDMSLPEWKK